MKEVDLGKQITSSQLCSQCGQMGICKLQFITIPKFGDMEVSSFKCKHCGYRNKDVQQLTEIQDYGVSYKVTIENIDDLQRSIIKSQNASIAIPEIEFQEAPSQGCYTNIEGFLDQIIKNLSQLQPERRAQYPDYAKKIDLFIQKVFDLKDLKQSFTFQLDDPSGNSYIQQYGVDDQKLQTKKYKRNNEQSKQVGLSEEQEKHIEQESKSTVVDIERVNLDNLIPESEKQDEETQYASTGNIVQLKVKCPACGADAYENNLEIKIPYFKQVLIMSCRCDECGFRTIELQPAGEISQFGRKTIFKVIEKDDINREILKSSSCRIIIPELDIEMAPGTMGSMYTTIEGLLIQLRNELSKNCMFYIGDSVKQSEEDIKQKQVWDQIFEKLEIMIKGDMKFTIVIDDPLDNSFIKDIYLPDGHDPNLTIQTYQRTKEQEEEFGLDLIDKGE